MKSSGKERFKADFWLKQYRGEGVIYSDGENQERNQLEDIKEYCFMFISYFYSDVSSLWGESVLFISISPKVPNITMPNHCTHGYAFSLIYHTLHMSCLLTSDPVRVCEDIREWMAGRIMLITSDQFVGYLGARSNTFHFQSFVSFPNHTPNNISKSLFIITPPFTLQTNAQWIQTLCQDVSGSQKFNKVTKGGRRKGAPKFGGKNCAVAGFQTLREKMKVTLKGFETSVELAACKTLLSLVSKAMM